MYASRSSTSPQKRYVVQTFAQPNAAYVVDGHQRMLRRAVEAQMAVMIARVPAFGDPIGHARQFRRDASLASLDNLDGMGKRFPLEAAHGLHKIASRRKQQSRVVTQNMKGPGFAVGVAPGRRERLTAVDVGNPQTGATAREVDAQTPPCPVSAAMACVPA